MDSKKKSTLTEALRRKEPVRFGSRYEAGWSHGYVLDIGHLFFLFASIGEDMRFDGFQCPLISAVRRLHVPDPHAEFVVAALRKRGQKVPRKPKVNLESLAELLKSANKLFPLIAIHRERVDPEVCEIGRVVEITKSHLQLHEIGPDADWDEELTKIRLKEMTRVEFGGGYEEALHLVGGEPKQLKKPSSDDA